MQVFVGVGPQRSEVVCDKVPHFSLFIYDIRWGGALWSKQANDGTQRSAYQIDFLVELVKVVKPAFE
jgi:hypothetical protein